MSGTEAQKFEAFHQTLSILHHRCLVAPNCMLSGIQLAFALLLLRDGVEHATDLRRLPKPQMLLESGKIGSSGGDSNSPARYSACDSDYEFNAWKSPKWGMGLKGRFRRGYRQFARTKLRKDTQAGAQMTYPALVLNMKAA